MSVPRDLETTTVEAAAGFERYHAEPDWDETLHAEEARRESFPRVFVDYPAEPGRARPGDRDLW